MTSLALAVASVVVVVVVVVVPLAALAAIPLGTIPQIPLHLRIFHLRQCLLLSDLQSPPLASH